MPVRHTFFAPDQIYHVFNRSINNQPVFSHTRNCERALLTLFFYQSHKRLYSLSRFLELNSENKERAMMFIKKAKKRIEILAFCLMPNHFHLLIREKEGSTTSRFLSDFQNSYTRYFNLYHERKGYLFQGQFKAIRVETDEELLHVSRYIHLNPYSSFLVKNFQQLKNYPWSSLGVYLKLFEDNVCEKKTLMSFFPSIKKFEQFIFDQKDYQRELQEIKHLILE